MRLIFFTFLFFFTTIFSFSQENKVIDSLKSEIEKDPKNYHLLKKVIKEYIYSNPDKLMPFCDEQIKRGTLSDDVTLIGLGYKYKAAIYLMKNDFDNSKKSTIKAINYLKKSPNLFFLGQVYVDYAQLLLFENNPTKSYKTLLLAIKYLKAEKNIKIAAPTMSIYYFRLASIYEHFSLYDEAIKNNLMSLKYCNYSSEASKRFPLNGLCSVYKHLENHKKSIYYQHIIIKECLKEKDYFNLEVVYINLADTYIKINDLENANSYNLKALEMHNKNYGNKTLPRYYYNIASILQAKSKNKESLEYIDKALKIEKNDANLKTDYYHSLMKKALTLYDLKEFEQSIKLLKECESYFIETDRKIVLKQIYFFKLKNYINLLQTNEAETHLNKYDSINKLMFNTDRANAVSLNIIKYETELKESQIKTQQLQIQKEKANKNFALAGIVFISLLTIGSFWLYRIKQNQKEINNQNTLLTLQQNLNAMQLDNLNKQLDPHEIKNILANISPEIQRNAPDAYNKMTKLLNLTRASLTSNSITDSIENQLQQIEDYLSLEKTVLSVPLSYTINNTFDTSKQIPRLLLKNLVENSIKHGIKNKKEGGEINIDLTEINNKLKITVDDTGIGRQQAISLDSGIGTSTYINLFETLNKINTQKASFNMIDKENGTKVEIYIPIDYKYS